MYIVVYNLEETEREGEEKLPTDISLLLSTKESGRWLDVRTPKQAEEDKANEADGGGQDNAMAYHNRLGH